MSPGQVFGFLHLSGRIASPKFDFDDHRCHTVCAVITTIVTTQSLQVTRAVAMSSSKVALTLSIVF
jgi:hypothetical protein